MCKAVAKPAGIPADNLIAFESLWMLQSRYAWFWVLYAWWF
jgi:hypothetical protein